jgi:Protein DA1
MSAAGRHPTGGDWLSAVPSAAGAFGLDTCPVCNRPMTVRRGVALTGEHFCDRHLDQEPCALCAMPADAHRLAIPLCRRCAVTSIRTSADVRRELPSVKHQLAELGIRTVSPVKVQLASAESLERIAGNHALGVTVYRDTSVVNLFVLQDLPLLKFGTTVAHEVMHTYMTQNGFGDVPSRVAEGLCQILAFAWIIRQNGMLAEAERRQIAENPDPIYGEGFRQAYEAVRRVGVRRTLATVKQQHRLP